MVRISMIVAVAIFCVLNARTPDPRMRAAVEALTATHTHAFDGNIDGTFYCPMDPDVRALRAGTCTRCGMTLVEGVPDILEYPLDLKIEPPRPHPTEVTRLTFGLTDPRTLQPVRRFEVVHEKPYHVFLVSQDLSFFLHTHPERQPDEDFHLDVRLPQAGMYRLLSDVYPSGGTPQLITSTLIVPGPAPSMSSGNLHADVAPKQTQNAHVELTLTPPAVAGERTALVFTLTPVDGLETYLGAWGHMLAASADLIDMVHGHPFTAADTNSHSEKPLNFSMVFPRAGVYRVWMEFQRSGIVNTVAFNIPVAASPQ